MEKGFKLQPNCKRRVNGEVLDPCSLRSQAGNTSAVFLLPPALCLLPSLIKSADNH
jgi:hypothetical protein